MRKALILAIALLLGGCVADRNAAVVQARSDVVACERPGATHVAIQRCRNAVILAAAERVEPGNIDVLRYGASAKMVLAEKLDAHQISQSEADLEASKLTVEMNDKFQQRGALAASTYSASPARSCVSNSYGGTTTTNCF